MPERRKIVITEEIDPDNDWGDASRVQQAREWAESRGLLDVTVIIVHDLPSIAAGNTERPALIIPWAKA